MQGRRGIDRSEGGLGLGLTIVRTLLELHGGKVHAHSEGPGEGSEFTIELGTLPQATASSSAPSETDAVRLLQTANPRRILIVDDNRDAADTLADALNAAGHVTRVAHDGPSALDVARHFEPEVARLDIGLPVMDGHEVGRR